MNQRARNEQGLRILEDVADLLKTKDELAREKEEHDKTRTELKLQRDRTDRYAAANNALGARCDHQATQLAEYRAKFEALAKAFENEGNTLAVWVTKQGEFIRECITESELAPYVEVQRPLALEGHS